LDIFGVYLYMQSKTLYIPLKWPPMLLLPPLLLSVNRSYDEASPTKTRETDWSRIVIDRKLELEGVFGNARALLFARIVIAMARILIE
jgi:hypothetical protein